MVIDTSAIVAILLGEDEAKVFLRKMNSAERRLMSAATLVELGAVLMNHQRGDIQHLLDPFVARAGIQIVPVDQIQAALGRLAYRKYGRGRHPAKLNLGDCFSYALAMSSGEPLLFKGEDFSRTDVGVA